AVTGEKTPARQLVARTFAEHGAGHITDVVLVEEKQRPQFRVRQRLTGARQAVLVQAPEIHALLEIDLHASRRLQRTVPAVAGIGWIVESVGTASGRLSGTYAFPHDVAGFRFLFPRHQVLPHG